MMADCPFPFNMQLFQEMKYKFPDIPVEIIQNCITKYPRDREACIQLLIKANMNCLDPSMITNFSKNHHYSINVHSKLPVTKNGSNSHFGNSLIYSPSRFINPHIRTEAKMEIDRQNIAQNSSTGNAVTRPCDVYSSPTVSSEFKPFNLMYSKNMGGEHSRTSQNAALYRAIFSSTSPSGWNYTSSAQIPPFVINKPTAQTSNVATNPLPSSSRENEAHHITTLKINPLLPYSYNPSSSIIKNVTSSGRHMTSVNLQLRPPSSETQTPIEITTTPLICGVNQKENSNFNSHVQISISSTGATLTAVRTNKKPPASCSVTDQQVPIQRNVPHASVISINKPNSTQELDIGSVQRASGHYSVIPQNLQSARCVNLNVPYSLGSFPHQPTQHVPQHHSAILDNQSVHTVVPNELAYTQALLLQQRTRLNFIQTVLNQEKNMLARIKTEVNSMEKDLLQRRLDFTAISNMTDIQNLREENRQLRVECHCLSMEVDLHLRGQVPLGETDEDFYRNIFTGPIGPIPPALPCQEAPEFTSTVDVSAEVQSNPEGFTVDSEDKDLWKCAKCTFANHPALKKCEMCEMSRTSWPGYTETGPTYCTQYHRIINAPQARHTVSPERNTRTWPRRNIGHVQIHVTQNRSTVPSKGLDIHLTHRYPRR